MATVKTLLQGNNILHINVTGLFSAADEVDAILVDKSALTGPDGVNEPSDIAIEEIQYTLSGYNYIALEWDNTVTDEVIEYLTGEGFFEYRDSGRKIQTPAAGTGDILLTTNGGAAGGAYSILIKCRLRQ